MQKRRELAGRVRARQTGTLVPSPLKRWMSPSLIERNFQCASLGAWLALLRMHGNTLMVQAHRRFAAPAHCHST